MSKKKNTLKDLDEFLKQQAATLVSPARLREQVEPTEPVIHSPAPIREQESPAVANKAPEKTISTASIASDLKQLAAIHGTSVNDEFCTLVLSAMQQQQEFSVEEKMLINTVLYIKHGANWKDAIRQYWKTKNS